MAQTGIVAPRFYPNDLINGERVDEHARVFSDAVNGGLTVKNLSPALRLANSAFAEPNTVYTMSSSLDFPDGFSTASFFPVTVFGVNTNVWAIGVLPAASKILGFSLVGMLSSSSPAPTTNRLKFLVGGNIAASYYPFYGYGMNDISIKYMNRKGDTADSNPTRTMLVASCANHSVHVWPAATIIFVGVTSMVSSMLYLKGSITVTFATASLA